MDLSFISIATSSISAAREICNAAIGLRDFNQMAAAVSQLRDQLLKAQDSLFDHNGQLFALQQEVFDLKDLLRERETALLEAQNEIAKLNQKKLELGDYERVRLEIGAFVYRRKNVAPDDETEPHYCASCFEREQLSALQPGTGQDRMYLVCHGCGFKTRR